MATAMHIYTTSISGPVEPNLTLAKAAMLVHPPDRVPFSHTLLARISEFPHETTRMVLEQVFTTTK
ncbi:uncharacterized protein Z518_00892 [Rhinocladiella mackenziei CBS 650.93]|uniref:Uncharacterized protein n=1 Tax=Rhinocladiella mackenziei CBS 650.93 TaxID=1442369 RepID=A0A0D2J270_9EURO|nr:uncharacterized protein Z518_00892 [Rhinocladiella mackenziei CBS 650.93]KIX09811.1 hypothetical protein Z518_00892 [Rhinocladiella mackenziei CBS 650.93]